MATRRAATREEILDAAWALAREHGLAGFSLRDLAQAVGMKAPSLYEYFDGKEAIYDAMFAQGYEQFAAAISVEPDDDVRKRFKAAARRFADFCAADPARFQLLFQRPIPGFVPSPASYEIAVAAYEQMRQEMGEIGITDQADLDLWTSISTGLVSQQMSNDPGGDRFVRLIDKAVDMYLEHVLPERG